MEKIEEKIKREVVDIHISYKAIDGTIFTDEKACKEYEENVAVVLLAELNEICINTHGQFDWFEDSSENMYKVVVPTKQSHLDIMNKLWRMHGGNHINPEDIIELPFTKKDLNTVILTGFRTYENRLDWVWFWKFNEMVEDATKGLYKLVKNDKE